MGTRAELQTELRTLLGSSNVYYQPPESVKMSYPAIVYNKDGIHTKSADDIKYYKKNRYIVTVIDKNPDSLIPDSIIALPMCSYDRTYFADNLNHFVFTLYY